MLYIANTTKQNITHCFRAPETGRSQMVEIPSGKQQAIGKDWSSSQIEGVINHLEIYGAKEAKTIKGKTENFSGLLYSTGAPIKDHQIVAGHEAVVDNQERTSADEATKSALAFDASNRGKTGKTKGKRMAKVTAVEVKQDVPKNEKATGKEVDFSMSVEDGGSDLKLKK